MARTIESVRNTRQPERTAAAANTQNETCTKTDGELTSITALPPRR